ncbi:MAG TPA: DUF2079 domain-containing protein [Candidatus Limnocylindria bacterium]|nr:DUF2079 domain-containing protein [Candidatus Limnocylindria bacterium]
MSRLARRETAVVTAIVVAWTILYAALAVLRHATWHSTAYDLAVFDQVFWNTVNGRPFESTLDRGVCQPTSFFGGHFAPVLFALVPFYAVFPRAETLLVIQTAALGVGAVPLYLISRELLRPGLERIAPVIAYLLIAPLTWMALFDFHEIAFAPVPLGVALLFVVRRRHWLAVATLVAAFLVKEEVPLVALGFVAVLLLSRAWLPAAVLLVASVAWFVTAVAYVIPSFAVGEYRYTSFYASLGATEVEILRTVLTDPGRTFAVLATDGRMKLRYLLTLFGPGLGLTVASLRFAVVVLPPLGYTLLSDHEHQYTGQTHYAATLIPLAVGTAAIGLARLRGRVRDLAPAAMLAASALFAFLYADVPLGTKFDASRFAREARYDAVAAAVAAIPADARVLATDHVAAQLAHRRFLYEHSAQPECGGFDVIVLDAADRQSFFGERARFDAEVERWRSSGYEEIARGDGLSVLRRR